MKSTSFPAKIAIFASLCLLTPLAFAQVSPRKAFGKGNPFKAEELTAGKLKSNLQSLNPQAKEKAMKWLHTFDFSEFDAAEHLRVDNGGGVYIVCPDDHGNCEGHTHGPASANETSSIVPEPAPSTYTDPPVANAAVSVSSPPIYSSKPGATRHIYLDFNGGIVTGTAWNNNMNYGNVASWNVKVWSQDADRTTFNDTEQAWMRRVWQRVAEDYAPFDVNVTTDVAYDPANYTGNKDMVGWLLICETTDNNGVALPHNGSGGVAYVGVFGDSTYSPTYQPAWVASNNGGGNEAIIAEAAAHEMGHNMGLSHDGTSTLAYYGGHVATASAPSWGPIMGTGYDRNVSQWSKGEYYDANQLQDDLSVMSARIPYRADDHGDNFAGATGVVATNNVISQSGIVETTNDPDVFSFTTGVGAITLTASSFRCDADTWGSNLDIQLEIYDSTQTLIASSNPVADVNASISTTITAAGTYYLVLKPSSAGTPLVSSPSGYAVYGSLGQYTISGTVQPYDPPLVLTAISPSSATAGTTVTVEITGTAFSVDTGIRLKQPGRADIVGTSVQLIGSTLRCQFNLAGAAAGLWSLFASNPDLETATLADAFTVIAVPTTLWSENFDGTVTGWASQAVSGTSNSWSLTTTQSYSPGKSYFAAGPSTTSVAYLISPSISIPTGPTNLQIEFWHRYNLQSIRDGGRLSLSLDGGSWFDVTDGNSGAAFTLNGYNTTMAATGQSGPFAGLQAWSGTNSTFSKTVISLNDILKYAGRNLRIRWEIATNNQTASTGWYVDSVSLLGSLVEPPPNQAPAVTVAASTSSAETQTEGATNYQIIRGTGTNLSVTATDDAGEPYLTYTWSRTSGPAAVVFSVNGNNAAKNTSATFSQIGDYLFTVTTLDAGNLSASSSVNVRVLATGTYVVNPSSTTVQVGATRQFNASLFDQFGTPFTSQPSPVNWSASGGGGVNTSGLFSATSAGGPFTITATGGSYTATASVSVNPSAASVQLTNLNQTYDGSSKPVTVITNPASLAYSVTYNGSSTVPIAAGNYAVVVTITDPNYSGGASGNLVVAKASQSINFSPLDPVSDYQGSLTLGASATSGLTVSYTSSNTAVATVSGSTVTIVSPGTTTITASQGGNTNYLAAANVLQLLTVVRTAPLVLTWDANGVSANRTDGGGVWLGANQWWDGTADLTWESGSNAIFGSGGTGGVVTLASPTSVNNITFNSFTLTYTLGSVGQAITLNNGITKNAGAGIVSIASPLILGGAQTWVNNSGTALNVAGTLDNGGFLLTVGGSANTSFTAESSVISGSGGLTKTGTGLLTLGGGVNPAHTYSGPTVIYGGVVLIGSAGLGTGNLVMNGGVLEQYTGNVFSRGLGTGAGQIQITGGDSGFSGAGSTNSSFFISGLANNELIWGSAYFAPGVFTLQSAYANPNGKGSMSNNIDLNGGSRTIAVVGGDTTGGFTLSGVIRNSSGTAGINKTGIGQLILTGVNTYNGPTAISGGRLALGADDVLPDSTAVSIDNATLDATTSVDTVGTLDITSTASINLENGAALAFADSSAIDWTGGTLNITGTFVSGASLRFGTSNTGLTSTQLSKISGTGLSSFALNGNGYLTASGGSGDSTPPTLAGSGIVDDKSGGAVALNTLVTYTVTFNEDMDAATVSADDFGNAGTAVVAIGAVSETTPGVFAVQATPTTAGTLQLRINAGAVLTDAPGNKLVTTNALLDETVITVNPPDPFAAWSEGAVFGADTNGDGVDNGLAWLLGAPSKDAGAVGLLPVASHNGGILQLSFRCLKPAHRGGAVLKVQYSRDLGQADDWFSHQAEVPDADGSVGGVFFDTTADADPAFINVRVEIPASAASPGTKLFSRLVAEQ